MKTLVFFTSMIIAVVCSAQDPTWVSEARKGNDVSFSFHKKDSKGEYNVITNWSRGYLEFQADASCDLASYTNPGQCETQAKKAARYLAYARAVEYLAGVTISGMVGMGKDSIIADMITLKYQGFIKGARVLNESFKWRNGPNGEQYGWGSARIGILLFGTSSDSTSALSIPLAATAPILAKMGYIPLAASPSRENATVETPFTGIILDARGFHVEPTMTPLVLVQDDETKMVYSASVAAREYALKSGIAGYAKTLDLAKADGRINNNGYTKPLVIRVATVRNNVLYVIADDAQKMFAANIASGVLDKCRVIIVVE
jgi:hypothetical protein